MSRFRRIVTRAGADADLLIDRIRRLRRRGAGPMLLLPYRGMGTAEELFIGGRVLEDRDILPPEVGHTPWRNLRSTWRRFGSREVPGVQVRATFQGRSVEVLTDEEGYFEVRLALTAPLDGASWQQVPLELPAHNVAITGEVLVPPPTARFAVISDIDDTVLRSYATDTLRMLRETLLRNARTRLPFEGVAELYQALVSGAGGAEQNPIFYVSSSPWNLYDLLVEFMAYHGLPAGPLQLTDYGFDRGKLVKLTHAEHKLARIDEIAMRYPALPLVLIGDSGQHDPEIYLEAARRYHGRIAAIYIRHVSDAQRADEVEAIVTRAASHGAPMLLVADSAAVAIDARARGLLR